MKIDFAWYLATWLVQFHGNEDTFWRRMNPARMYFLISALAPKKEPQKASSLYEYLTGG